MPRPVLITPSILSADLGDLQAEVDSIRSADWIQVDVMDGKFVENVTNFGAPVLRPIKTALPLDIHLMVVDPAEWIDRYLDIGAKHITFHAEAVPQTSDRKALIKAIKAGGATAGIAMNLETPVSEIDDVISDVDLVLVMSVYPGKSGQSFIPVVLSKVKALRSAHPDLMIQMDGGISDKNAKLCKDAGADNLVAATYVFSAQDRAGAISLLRSI